MSEQLRFKVEKARSLCGVYELHAGEAESAMEGKIAEWSEIGIGAPLHAKEEHIRQRRRRKAGADPAHIEIIASRTPHQREDAEEWEK